MTLAPGTRVGPYALGREYDVHPDGERFLLGGRSASLPAKMVVVVNWIEELKLLVPTGR